LIPYPKKQMNNKVKKSSVVNIVARLQADIGLSVRKYGEENNSRVCLRQKALLKMLVQMLDFPYNNGNMIGQQIAFQGF